MTKSSIVVQVQSLVNPAQVRIVADATGHGSVTVNGVALPASSVSVKIAVGELTQVIVTLAADVDLDVVGFVSAVGSTVSKQ